MTSIIDSILHKAYFESQLNLKTQMKAQVTLKNVHSEHCKEIILRNLARVLDTRVLNFDPKSKRLTFLYINAKGLCNVLEELRRIGFPVQNRENIDSSVGIKPLTFS